MSKSTRYKSLIHYIIGIGAAKSQKEVGQMIGYTSESSFSQVINGIVREPKEFSSRFLCMVPNLNLAWLETGEGEMLNPDQGINISGNKINTMGDVMNNSNSVQVIVKAMNEISEMRRLVHRQIEINKEQFDRMMSVIDTLSKKQ